MGLSNSSHWRKEIFQMIPRLLEENHTNTQKQMGEGMRGISELDLFERPLPSTIRLERHLGLADLKTYVLSSKERICF
jgi:hypothetical protein